MSYTDEYFEGIKEGVEVEEKKKYKYKTVVIYFNEEDYKEIEEYLKEHGVYKFSWYIKSLIFKEVRGK